ncbi:MAG: methyltransferase family protein [Candidatus Hodarchaeota archaeon]
MSPHEHSDGIGNEHPRSHQIQLFCFVLFLLIWIIDSFLLNLTTQLSKVIPIPFRLFVFIILALIAYRLVDGSHKLVLTGNSNDEPKVVTGDVYAYLRHPMYFAYIITFFALIQLTMSIISLIPLVITFFLLNVIASYEEKELVKILGQEYINYMNRVHRWVPNLLNLFNRD